MKVFPVNITISTQLSRDWLKEPEKEKEKSDTLEDMKDFCLW